MTTTAKEWFEAYGGIKNKATREMVMMLDSKALLGTGYHLKIMKRGHIIVQPGEYLKEFRRTVRHSKEVSRSRNQV